MSKKHEPGVACQRRSIVGGRGAHCRKLRERERERRGGGCEKEKAPLTTDPTLQYVPMPVAVS